MKPFQFGLIVPSYHFARGLESSLGKIAAWRSQNQLSFLLCLVDDGSTDATPEIMSRFAEQNAAWCLVHRLSQNQGKGGAIRAGAKLLLERGLPYLLFTDCDLYYGLDIIQRRMLPALESGADVAILDRSWSKQFHAQSSARKLLSYSFNHLKTILTSVTFEDSQAGLKGFRAEFLREAIPVSRINGFAFDVEILSIAQQFRFRVDRIPIKRNVEEHSEHSSVTIRNALRMSWDLLRIAYARYRGAYQSSYFFERICSQVYEIEEESYKTRP